MGARSVNRLGVVTYHRVAEPAATPELNPRSVTVSPRRFERQMRILLRHRTVVSLADVVRAVETGAPLPPRAVLITFDDAYADLSGAALPILERLGIPATIFVPTAFPDHPERGFHTDRIHRGFTRTTRRGVETPIGRLPLGTPEERRSSVMRVEDELLKKMRHQEAESLVEALGRELGVPPLPTKSVLGWDELRAWAARGFSLAAHSRNHVILVHATEAEIRDEVAGARQDLEREIGSSPAVFCYPNGSHDEKVVSIVREEGYRIAFTTLHGANDLATADPLRLCRTHVGRATSPFLLRLRTSAWGARLDAWRHRRTEGPMKKSGARASGTSCSTPGVSAAQGDAWDRDASR